ncbi:MAG: AAA family ATPase [Syntrophomonadaceae bacterium]|nr:AAA family ATPase [Syntrophomonadaceae bacterium]
MIGYNIMPLVLFGGLAVVCYMFLNMQGVLRFNHLGSQNGKKRLKEVSFDDIGGQDSAINELGEALEFLRSPDLIRKMGIRPLKGVLLVGPPGTGKTLMAKAAANYTSSVFMAASGSEFIEMYAGVGAKRVRQLFNEARKKAVRQSCHSAIIFIDELEILGAKRGKNSSHMEYDQTLNQLLVEMDGINPDDTVRVLLIGATNRADMLDPALLRPGRFDRQVQVNLPDKMGRRKILEIHTRNKPLADRGCLDEIAAATFGFSGAHLESLANEAAILAMREQSPVILSRHFNEAIDKVILGEKLERKPSLEEVERVSVHESGHALLSETLLPGSVSSVTIVPRGQALGFMRKKPPDDQYLYTREQLEKEIMIALGGAVAEEIKYGNRSTGAKGDFKACWNTARQIVEAGLSSLGIVHADDLPQESLFEECKNIIVELEHKAVKLLLDKKEALFALAASLQQEETIERQRFVEIIN